MILVLFMLTMTGLERPMLPILGTAKYLVIPLFQQSKLGLLVFLQMARLMSRRGRMLKM